LLFRKAPTFAERVTVLPNIKLKRPGFAGAAGAGFQRANGPMARAPAMETGFSAWVNRMTFHDKRPIFCVLMMQAVPKTARRENAD
jgi:hypothetical protein